MSCQNLKTFWLKCYPSDTQAQIDASPVSQDPPQAFDINLQKWCPGAESNHRHEDFQSTALPLSYPGTEKAEAFGWARSRLCRGRCPEAFLQPARQCGPKVGTSAVSEWFSISSTSSNGTRYWPFSQFAKSRSAQRPEQKGRYLATLARPQTGQVITAPRAGGCDRVCVAAQNVPAGSSRQARYPHYRRERRRVAWFQRRGGPF